MASSIMAWLYASILAALPTVRVSLVIFDTKWLINHLAHDPVEVLMTVQLGAERISLKSYAILRKFNLATQTYRD